jgi:hypothetical protein
MLIWVKSLQLPLPVLKPKGIIIRRRKAGVKIVAYFVYYAKPTLPLKKAFLNDYICPW